MTQEIKNRIEEIKDELDALYERGMDGAEDVHDEVQAKVAELKAELEKLRGEIDRTITDAKGFFERNKIAIFIAAGVLALGGIVLLIL
jgi:peptidoglycan hydrolase CwlO-like protein